MDIPQSVVLGVVQGLTEFIPVSSTAHLILAPEFGVTRPRAEIAHSYDTFIQIGTLLPVLLYFWRDWLNLLRAAWRLLMGRGTPDNLDERLFRYIMVGSVPAGVIGLALESKIEMLAQPDRWPPAYLCVGGALIGVGLLMWVVEASSPKTRTLENLKLADALFVGFAQAAALFPGVSRSGSTITAGLFTGMTREAAARFSFLLMTPIMIAATAYKTVKLFTGAEPVTADEWSGMLLAAAVAAVTGYAAIAFLLRWLRTRSMAVFAVWRILVGAFAIGLYFVQGHNRPAPATPAAVPTAISRPAVAAPVTAATLPPLAP